MHPPSRAAAQAGILATEAAVENLSREAFDLWLPAVLPLVLPSLTADASAPLPPNVAAVSGAGSTQWWDLALDQVIVYGLGLIFGREFLEAYGAIGGDATELRSADNVPAIHGRTTIQAPLPSWAQGQVDQLEVARTVQTMVGRPFDESRSAMARTDATIAEMPTVRAFQANYLAGVRNRMTDIPHSVFADITGVLNKGLESGDNPVDMRDAIGAFLDQSNPTWMQRAVLIARTESCGAQSMASLNAAQARQSSTGTEMEKTWGATDDARTRPTHRLADGQRVPLDGKFVVGLSHMDAPGDPSAPADEVCNCRCRLYVLATDEFIPERPSRGAAIVAAGQETMMTGPTTAPTRTYRGFTGTLALLDTPTDDGRLIAGNADLAYRDFPIPLMWQKQTEPGHMQSYTVGCIESAGVVGNKIMAEGYFLDTPEADEAVMQAQHGVTGPSVDLGDVSWELRDDNGKTITYEDMWDLPFDAKVTQVVTKAKVLGTTLVAKPAFGGTSVTVTGDVERGGVAADTLRALVASVAAEQETERKVYDAALFANPNFTRPTPRTYDPETGRVMGHLGQWGVCHVGIQKRCQMLPHSATDYAYFKTNPSLDTTDGPIRTGRLTVATGHAPDRRSIGQTMAHYDNTGTCWAWVNIGEDEHGVWFSGIVDPSATPERIAEGMAAPLSGDWRPVAGGQELVAALSVNTPGFPILTASVGEDGTGMLVASAFSPCPTPEQPPTSALDLKAVARAAIEEMRADERRRASALTLIDEQRRAETAALLKAVK